MQRALGALEEKGILRRESEGGKARLRFADPLFPTWVRETIAPPP